MRNMAKNSDTIVAIKPVDPPVSVYYQESLSCLARKQDSSIRKDIGDFGKHNPFYQVVLRKTWTSDETWPLDTYERYYDFRFFWDSKEIKK